MGRKRPITLQKLTGNKPSRLRQRGAIIAKGKDFPPVQSRERTRGSENSVSVPIRTRENGRLNEEDTLQGGEENLEVGRTPFLLRISFH